MKIEYRDAKAIKKARRLQKEAAALHMIAPPLALLNWEVMDKNGEVIEKSFGKSNSYVRNAYNWFVNMCTFGTFQSVGFGAGDAYNWKQTSGSAKNNGGIQSSGLCVSNVYPAAGTTTYGILVGSGSTAESFEDYVLITPIAHGVSAGQLQYAAQASGVTTWDGVNKKWTASHRRTFTNNSGGNVTIREVGFALNITIGSGVYILFSRDVLGTPKVLSNGQSVTYEYLIEYTFPA